MRTAPSSRQVSAGPPSQRRWPPGCSRARSIPASCRSSARSPLPAPTASPTSTRRSSRDDRAEYAFWPRPTARLSSPTPSDLASTASTASATSKGAVRHRRRAQHHRRHAGQRRPLNGTAQDDLILGLAGADTLNGLAGNDILVGGADGTTSTTSSVTYADNFNDSSLGNSNGTANWGPDWVESGDGGGSTASRPESRSTGTMRQYALRFRTPVSTSTAPRSSARVNLGGATAATLSLLPSRERGSTETDGDSVTVFFSRNGTNFVEVDQITNASALTAPQRIDLSALWTGPFTANAAIRFVTNSSRSRRVRLDRQPRHHLHDRHLNTGVDTLNGGLGDDTYSFTLGDGNDVINEGVNATSGGSADRISILAPITGSTR